MGERYVLGEKHCAGVMNYLPQLGEERSCWCSWHWLSSSSQSHERDGKETVEMDL